MIHSVRFTCVLDTNIIFPIEIRDLFFILNSDRSFKQGCHSIYQNTQLRASYGLF